MPVPSPRNKILPARGNFADLSANVASLLDGEICYAIDQDQYYQNEGGTLVSVGATKTQGALADSAVQPGDNISTLTNDSAFVDAAGASAAAPVQSVASKTGDVTLVKGDVGLDQVDNTSDANKPISTATQGALDLKADLVGGVIPNSQLPSLAITEYLGTVASEAALLALTGQRGDWAIRTDTGSTWVITTDGGSTITDWTELATPADAVSSVNGFTGTVVLGASDVGAATAAQGALADTAVQRAGDTMTGALGMPVGSDSSPSIYFDANTGLYSPGADQVAISTGGTGRLFVDANGNVGLGTSSPQERLDVAGNGASFLRWEHDGASGSYNASTSGGVLRIGPYFANTDLELALYGDNSGTFWITTGTAQGLNLGTNKTSRIYISSSGLVGIGTSTPGALLTVNGNATISGTLGTATVDTQLGNVLDINDFAITTTVTDGDIDIDADGAGLLKVTEYNLAAMEVVTKHDIGTNANEVPLNGFLGAMAYKDDLAIANGILVADLPTAPTARVGNINRVTDGAAALAWGATVTGGGSTPYLVWFNGTSWTVFGA